MLVTALSLTAWLDWKGWPFLRDPLARMLSTQLHREVRLDGHFALHLWRGLRLETDEVRVSQPDWVAPQSTPASASPMVVARGLRLHIPFGTLWDVARHNGRIDPQRSLGSVEAGRLDAVLMRAADGRANWQFTPPPADAQAQPGSDELPRFDHLVVREGLLALVDEPTRLRLTARISTAEGTQNQQGGGLDMRGGGTYMDHPFEVHLSTTGILPVLSQRADAPPIPMEVKAQAGSSRLSFEGVTHDILHLGQLDGDLRLSGPSLSAIGDVVHVTLPTTAKFALQGRLKKDGEVWRLNMQSLHVGESQLQGQFSFDRRGPRARLQGEVTGPQMALVDLAPAFGAAPKDQPRPVSPSGRVLPQREFDVPSLQAMDADVKMHIDKVKLGAWFAMPLQPLVAQVVLQSGVLKIHHLLAQTAGGSLAGSMQLDSNRKPVAWQAQLKWDKIKLENWLKSPPKPGAEPAPDARTYVSGELAGQAELTGTGNSTAALLASLDGRSDIWVRHGEVSRLLVEAISLHVAEALGLLIVGDKQQPMQCAAARLQAKRGLIMPDVAIVDTPASTILVSGVVSLAQEKLDLTLASHPKSTSPLSLRTPVDVTGTFSDPQISLHPKPLGMKVLGSLIMGAIAPLAGVVPLIDVGRAPDDGCARVLQSLSVKPSNP